ncbi:MAG: HPr family phosphocarrier protein [Ruminococcaceae bacterium]|nr:HPr family phosphocarrier protein [Oscillospiraceae bacterium]
MKTFEYTIKDNLGIHARPAGMLAKKVKDYQSSISIKKGDKEVSCSKLMALMGLGVKYGDTVTINISGPDEDIAEKEIKTFLETNL